MLAEPASRSDPEESIRDRVFDMVADKASVEPPSWDTDLLESGLLDSLALVDLMAALENEFGIVIDLEMVDLERFRSVESIAVLVAEQHAGGGGDDGATVVELAGAIERRGRR